MSAASWTSATVVMAAGIRGFDALRRRIESGSVV